MPSHYVNITKEDMHDFLFNQGFKIVDTTETSQFVYGKRIKHPKMALTLRVFTAINRDGNSRDVGSDSIQVALMLGIPNGTYIGPDDVEHIKYDVKFLGGEKRVHRTQNWRKNLQDRIDACMEQLPKDVCTCGMPMVKRKGQYGEFLSCVVCRGTRPLPKTV